MISYIIIERHEVYTLAELRKAYDEFTKGTRLRSLNLKEMLIAKFGNNLKFVKSSYNTSSKTSEYVLSSSDELIADCINAAGEGIQLSVALRNTARPIRLAIQKRSTENPKLWPPVPQDIIGKSEEKGNICLYNLIALIVSPNSPFDIDGSVKLSKVKATKVTKICSDIESLIPNTTPSLCQILLSLSMYRKTGSSTVIDDLHKFGHGIPYTETKFIEDKWAEWSEQQSSLLPSNIGKGLITTLLFDNIDWKNKDHKGKETHNTNSILIQEIPSQCNFTRVNLNPNYDFKRSKNRSFKAFETNLEPVTFIRSQCKDLIYKENNYEEEYNDSKNRILAWVMSRLTISRHSEQSIPS